MHDFPSLTIVCPFTGKLKISLHYNNFLFVYPCCCLCTYDINVHKNNPSTQSRGPPTALIASYLCILFRYMVHQLNNPHAHILLIHWISNDPIAYNFASQSMDFDSSLQEKTQLPLYLLDQYKPLATKNILPTYLWCQFLRNLTQRDK